MKRQFAFTVEEILEIVAEHLRAEEIIDDGQVYIEVSYQAKQESNNTTTITGMTFTVEDRPEPAPVVKLVR